MFSNVIDIHPWTSAWLLCSKKPLRRKNDYRCNGERCLNSPHRRVSVNFKIVWYFLTPSFPSHTISHSDFPNNGHTQKYLQNPLSCCPVNIVMDVETVLVFYSYNLSLQHWFLYAIAYETHSDIGNIKTWKKYVILEQWAVPYFIGIRTVRTIAHSVQRLATASTAGERNFFSFTQRTDRLWGHPA
jgi:hypothetical protein